jgi:hypothetical protein
MMLADIGTKALDPTRFEILRDAMTGYSLLDAIKQGNVQGYTSMMMRLMKKICEEWQQ